jgi:SAM-dependent methyltransferase
MVHALKEIHRVLAPDGVLIDLRPLAGSWPVEVASGREVKEAGRVSDMPVGLEDDKAANESIAQAASQDRFAREREEFFSFFYYWDSPNEMQAYIEEEWADFISIDESTWKNVRSLWAVADADARLRVRLRMLITRWKKQ